ncbi:MAG TPA: hypothetical protein VFM93_09430 [Candidatus Limnocylindria bacterium]|nr:hypothetical protein [Candidatus Limnocylindria bacterium]
MRRALLGLVALGLAFVAGGSVAAAADGGEVEEPGCVPGATGFIVRMCLSTPPPFGASRSAAGAPTVAVEAPVAGLFLDAIRTTVADLRIESRVGSVDRAAIAAAVEQDVPAVEREYGRTFAAPPRVSVFATVASFEHALQVIHGYSAAVARSVSGAGGVLDRASRAIAVNWQRVAHERPITIIRHELVHLMTRQILGREADVPAWFDEGLAVLGQREAGASKTVSDDHVAGAVLASRRLTLAQLVTAESWLRAAAAGPEAYAVAGAAADTLRREAGSEGVVRLLESVGRGRSFEEAFAEVTQRSVETFEDDLGAAVSARAPAALRVLPGRDAAGNATFIAAGFPANAPVELVIEGASDDGRAYRIAYVAVADASGTVRGTFGSTAPPGTYAIRARAGAISTNTVLRTSSR